VQRADQNNENKQLLLNPMQTILAESRFGRVLLHVVCALRDHHLRWHWKGIRREFAAAS